MQIINLKFEEIEDYLEQIYEQEAFTDYEDYMIQNSSLEKDMIIAYAPICRVTDLGLIFMEGTYCQYNEETDTAEPDWSLTLIYEDVPDEEFKPENYLYFEQDSPTVSIHNFLYLME